MKEKYRVQRYMYAGYEGVEGRYDSYRYHIDTNKMMSDIGTPMEAIADGLNMQLVFQKLSQHNISMVIHPTQGNGYSVKLANYDHPNIVIDCNNVDMVEKILDCLNKL